MGTFVHHELNTSDLAAAKKFYNGLFGWSFQDMTMPDGSVYSMFSTGENEGGGIQDHPVPGAPSAWLAVRRRRIGQTVDGEGEEARRDRRRRLHADPAAWRPRYIRGSHRRELRRLGAPGRVEAESRREAGEARGAREANREEGRCEACCEACEEGRCEAREEGRCEACEEGRCEAREEGRCEACEEGRCEAREEEGRAQVGMRSPEAARLLGRRPASVVLSGAKRVHEPEPVAGALGARLRLLHPTVVRRLSLEPRTPDRASASPLEDQSVSSVG